MNDLKREHEAASHKWDDSKRIDSTLIRWTPPNAAAPGGAASGLGASPQPGRRTSTSGVSPPPKQADPSKVI